MNPTPPESGRPHACGSCTACDPEAAVAPGGATDQAGAPFVARAALAFLLPPAAAGVGAALAGGGAARQGVAALLGFVAAAAAAAVSIRLLARRNCSREVV